MPDVHDPLQWELENLRLMIYCAERFHAPAPGLLPLEEVPTWARHGGGRYGDLVWAVFNTLPNIPGHATFHGTVYTRVEAHPRATWASNPDGSRLLVATAFILVRRDSTVLNDLTQNFRADAKALFGAPEIATDWILSNWALCYQGKEL